MFEANELPLFSLGLLSNDLASMGVVIGGPLQNWNPDDLLNRPPQDVVDIVIERASVQCPRLLVDRAWMPQVTEIDRDFEDFGRWNRRRVTRMVLVIPFEGEKVVFTLRPDNRTLNPPRVLQLSDHEVRLAIDDPPHDPTEANAIFDGKIQEGPRTVCECSVSDRLRML